MSDTPQNGSTVKLNLRKIQAILGISVILIGAVFAGAKFLNSVVWAEQNIETLKYEMKAQQAKDISQDEAILRLRVATEYLVDGMDQLLDRDRRGRERKMRHIRHTIAEAKE